MSEENPRWVEEEVPSPDDDEPTQLSQTLITSDLPTAFNISTPNQSQNQIITHHEQQNEMQLPPSPLPPLSGNGNPLEADFQMVDLGGDDPGRTRKRARFVWTPQLHNTFVDAVTSLGTKATPKTIIPLMNVGGLSRAIVQSHLQKYRLYLRSMRVGSNGGLYGVDSGINSLSFASSLVPRHFLRNADRVMRPYVPLTMTVTPTPPQPPLSVPPLSVDEHENEDSSGDELDEVSSGGDEQASTRKGRRLVWTSKLHKKFVDAFTQLGTKATPRAILEVMKVGRLTREQVASHLQKYRLYLRRRQGYHSGRSSGGNYTTDRLFASATTPAYNFRSNADLFMSPYMQMEMPIVEPHVYPDQQLQIGQFGNSFLSNEAMEPHVYPDQQLQIGQFGNSFLSNEAMEPHVYPDQQLQIGQFGNSFLSNEEMEPHVHPDQQLQIGQFGNSFLSNEEMEPHVYPDQQLQIGQFGNSFLSDEEIEQRPPLFFTRLLLED